MKRSEALKPLSREHHHALFVSKEVRDADESGAEEARSAFLEFWRTEGALHFRIEEEVLLPGSGLAGPDQDEEVARMLADHLEIRRRFRRVEAGETDLDEMKDLAGILRDHVRFEERELFPRIEREMDDDALLLLADRIEAAEKDSFGGPARRPPRRD
ncbi:MAG: hemerythrin domain-containing protein [Actinomycetota bacterium]|nr:hemerythrin domain-containing protein [Actinomycetota bacterium]